MKTRSRMRTPVAGRTCLLVFLCLSAGCWDSQSKQEVSDQPTGSGSGTTVSNDQRLQKTTESGSAKKSAATLPVPSSADELGFNRTWKPKPTPPAKSSGTTLAVVVQAGAEDNRYAELAPAPVVANQGESNKTPAYDPRSAEQKHAEPAKLGSTTSDAPSVDNPLRDPRGATMTGRPEAPPQPTVVPEPASAIPEKPSSSVTLPPQLAPKSELIIQTKPNEATTAPSPMPAMPVAPMTEKKTVPKVPDLGPAKRGPRTNKNSGVPFDPIKENGPIFVDWPKPKLALVITGQQNGYLEPCGCAGLDRMKGGMSRRYSLFRQLREKDWPVVGIDVGGIGKGFGKQAELRFQIAINAMSEMRYSAAALGLTDLHLPTPEVMALTMPADAKKKTMFVSGNVGLFEFNESLLPRTQLIAAGYKTIGITSVLGKTYLEQLAGNSDLKMTSPEKLLNEAVPMLKSRANYLILLAHTTHEEAIELANKYPDFDLVICAEGGAEPPAQAKEIHKGGTKLIEVGEKGMYAVVLGMFDDPQQPLRYQRVTLDSRFPASPEMLALMAAYQGQLKDLGLSGLGIRPLEHPLKKFNGDFVGTDACTKCHEESYRVWKKSPHSRAFASLQNANPPRNFDPECISCHTVGWHPTKFFPYQSGYLSEKESPKLLNVGCENCHGPGQVHVRAENWGTKAEQIAARKTVVITKEEAADPNSRKQNCWSCHDLDNSPEFKFNLYWPYVKHYEHEQE
ncbi:MAG: multiheme c-type cytochrome [Planctomycetota bacterium]